MNLTKAERKELSDLSVEVLGTRSAWQKILCNGILVPYNQPGPIKARGVYRLDIEGLRTYLQDLKRQKEEALSKIKAEEEAKKAAEVAEIITEKVEV